MPTLKDQWYSKAAAPAGKYYELLGRSRDIAERSFAGQDTPLQEAKDVGFTQHQITVWLGKNTFNALAQFPILYRLQVGNNTFSYYAYVPTAYNGAHTPVVDGRLIDSQKELNLLNAGLFANGHSTPVQKYVFRDLAVKVPEDFSGERHLFHFDSFDY
ncbi:MAG: hypothetical protein RBR86_09130 [Pseudobdellovibrionaceae bacterium]|jgi:hypothetical protein|nr:hypothetical protein [Pseudobdellovibrionaceae bacterium]